MQAYATTAAETASLTATRPTYDREGGRWPTCEGKCIDGMCALRQDHPTCCEVPRPGLYPSHKHGNLLAEQAVHTAGGWDAYDSSLYCWR
jgi:hypothetical protein